MKSRNCSVGMFFRVSLCLMASTGIEVFAADFFLGILVLRECG